MLERTVLKCLDIQSLGRCEQTCKTIRSAADVAWKYYEEEHIGQLNTSKTSADVRTRVNRFCMASSFVEERVEVRNAWHGREAYIRAYQLEEGENYCSRLFMDQWERNNHKSSCPFPDEFNDLFLEHPGQFELFMCMSSYAYSGSMILFEGFVPTSNIESERKAEDRSPTLSIDFRGLDFRRWSQMNDLLYLHGDKASKMWKDLSIDGLSMRATLIARPLRAGLVCAYFLFENWPEHDDEQFEVCAEGHVATCPHRFVYKVGPNSCRIILLARDNAGDGFVGWKIEDGKSPEYNFA